MDLYNVYQTFQDGSYEQVRSWVPAEEAVEAARHYCRSVGAQLGFTVDVKITDADDCCVFHWVRGKGVVFPPREEAIE